MSIANTFSGLAGADLPHRLAKMILVGTVAETDYESARVKVKIGDWLTTWLPWLTARSSHDISWHALEVGEQVLVFSPCGDTAQGVVLGSIYQQQQQELVSDVAAPERQNMHRVKYQDGSVIEYDRTNHKYLIDIKGADADVNIVSAGTLTITTAQDIRVNTEQNATVAAAGNVDVTGEKISLNGGASCVTTAHMCHFTGSPHGDGSSTVTAGK